MPSGLLFQKRPGSEQSLGYHQETETRGEWKVARNEIQDSVLLTKQEGRGRKVHLMVDRPELLKK